MTERSAVHDWIARYEAAWRAPGAQALDALFDDVTYVVSPWATPIVGSSRCGGSGRPPAAAPDEAFRMDSEIIAVEGATAVVRVDVDDDDGQRWRDIWVLTLGDGRCERFEEWPFAPDQDDGHGNDHG